VVSDMIRTSSQRELKRRMELTPGHDSMTVCNYSFEPRLAWFSAWTSTPYQFSKLSHDASVPSHLLDTLHLRLLRSSHVSPTPILSHPHSSLDPNPLLFQPQSHIMIFPVSSNFSPYPPRSLFPLPPLLQSTHPLPHVAPSSHPSIPVAVSRNPIKNQTHSLNSSHSLLILHISSLLLHPRATHRSIHLFFASSFFRLFTRASNAAPSGSNKRGSGRLL
jgi:hypothetical protein